MSISPIGDSVALAKVFKEIIVAFQDFSDAKEDFQRTAVHLETIDGILSCFENISVTAANQSIINAIRAQAHHAGSEVRAAKVLIEGYRSSLGRHSSSSSRRDAFARLKWSQFVKASKGRLAKVETVVDCSIQNINALLGLHHVDASSRLHTATTDYFQALQSNIARQHRSLQDVDRQASQHSLLLQQIQRLALDNNNASQTQLQELVRLETSISNTITSYNIAQQTSTASALDASQLGVHLHLDMTSQAIQTRMALAQDLHALRDLLSLHINQCQVASTTLPPNSTNITLVLSLPKVNLPLQYLTVYWLWLHNSASIIHHVHLLSVAVAVLKVIFIWPDFVSGCYEGARLRRRIIPPTWDVKHFQKTQDRFMARNLKGFARFFKAVTPVLSVLQSYLKVATSVPPHIFFRRSHSHFCLRNQLLPPGYRLILRRCHLLQFQTKLQVREVRSLLLPVDGLEDLLENFLGTELDVFESACCLASFGFSLLDTMMIEQDKREYLVGSNFFPRRALDIGYCIRQRHGRDPPPQTSASAQRHTALAPCFKIGTRTYSWEH